MDFTFSTEQDDFRAAVRGRAASRGALGLRAADDRGPRGVTPELWAMMADLGWLGVLVPESAGGLGLGFSTS